jgi:hypothetical protein
LACGFNANGVKKGHSDDIKENLFVHFSHFPVIHTSDFDLAGYILRGYLHEVLIRPMLARIVGIAGTARKKAGSAGFVVMQFNSALYPDWRIHGHFVGVENRKNRSYSASCTLFEERSLL